MATELKDLISPKIKKKDSSEGRVTMPSYVKDIASAGKKVLSRKRSAKRR